MSTSEDEKQPIGENEIDDPEDYDDYSDDESESSNSFIGSETSSQRYLSEDNIDDNPQTLRAKARKRARDDIREAKADEKEKLAFIQNDTEKEAIVQQAYLKTALDVAAGKSVPIGTVQGKGRWQLYSSEMYEYYYVGSMHTDKEMTFHNGTDYYGVKHFGAKQYKEMYGVSCGPKQLFGEFHARPEGDLDICPFDMPTQASLTPLVLKCFQSKRDLKVIFLGNGFLKVRLPLDTMFAGSQWAAKRQKGKVIEFSGIWTRTEDLWLNRKR